MGSITILAIWLVILVAFIAIDLLTSNFLFIWMGIGVIGAMICEAIGLNLITEIIVFVILSIIATSIGYPVTKNLLRKTVAKTPTMEEGYIGKSFKAIEDIVDEGKIMLNGNYWRAENKGEKIKKGDYFKVVDIKGNKIIITKKLGG